MKSFAAVTILLLTVVAFAIMATTDTNFAQADPTARQQTSVVSTATRVAATSTAQAAVAATETAAVQATQMVGAVQTAAQILSGIVPTPEPPSLLNPRFLDDTSLVDNQPCGAPCWREIVVGETSWEDALAQLENDPSLEDVKVERNEESGEIAATFQRRGGVPCCLMYTRDGERVEQMLLQLAPDSRLGNVIGNLGEPTYVSGTEISPEQAVPALFYPERQLVIYAFVAGAAEGIISADSPVFAALYLTENDMHDVIETSNLYLWRGYDTYRSYMTQPFDITPQPTANN